MRYLARLTLFLFLATAAFGQRGGGHGGGYGGGGRGFGGGFGGGGRGFGGGSVGGGRGFGGGGFSRGGGVHGGFGFRGGVGFGGHRFFGFGFNRFSPFGFWPYSYPVFLGGYWDGGYPYDYGYPYAYPYGYGDGYPGSNVEIISIPVPPPAASAPVVIEQHIQPAPARSVMHEYTPSGEPKSEPKTDNKPPLYLIAVKNSVIYAAEAYWVEGPTLHYVTLQHERRDIPLSKVDRDLSQRLNSERKVPFHLPQ